MKKITSDGIKSYLFKFRRIRQTNSLKIHVIQDPLPNSLSKPTLAVLDSFVASRKFLQVASNAISAPYLIELKHDFDLQQSFDFTVSQNRDQPARFETNVEAVNVKLLTFSMYTTWEYRHCLAVLRLCAPFLFADEAGTRACVCARARARAHARALVHCWALAMRACQVRRGLGSAGWHAVRRRPASSKAGVRPFASQFFPKNCRNAQTGRSTDCLDSNPRTAAMHSNSNFWGWVTASAGTWPPQETVSQNRATSAPSRGRASEMEHSGASREAAICGATLLYLDSAISRPWSHALIVIKRFHLSSSRCTTVRSTTIALIDKTLCPVCNF